MKIQILKSQKGHNSKRYKCYKNQNAYKSLTGTYKHFYVVFKQKIIKTEFSKPLKITTL